MHIDKHIERWVKAGLLSPDKGQALSKFEEENPSSSWVLFGISGLGILVLMTGIVSLIAANWYEIPDNAKLLLYFIALSAIGLAIWKRRAVPGVVFECLLTAFALFVLAGIGLIGQIYNLESDGYSAIFMWLALVLPITLQSESRLLNNLWFIGLITALGLRAANSENELIFQGRLMEIIAAPYVFLALGYGLAKWVSLNFCRAARQWSYLVILLGFGITANIAWSIGSAKFLGMFELQGFNNLPIYAAILACVASYLRNIQPGKQLTISILATIIASAILIIPPICFGVEENDLIGCLLFILAWSGAAYTAAMLSLKRLFDFCALVIGVRFIVVYFEVLGTLAATGIGLILSGCVILGIAYLWHKKRGSIAKAIREAA